MTGITTTALLPQSPDVAPQDVSARIEQLRKEAAQLEVRAHDLSVQRDQIRMQQDISGLDRARFNKPVMDAEHQVAVTMAELNGTKTRLKYGGPTESLPIPSASTKSG